MLIDHTNGRVLDVLKSREKAAVVAWLTAARNSGLLAELEEVTCDMWDGYVNAAREVFGPTLRITIDRFHVMQQFQQRLDEARREAQHQAGAKKSQMLKSSRWLLLKNAENYTPEEVRSVRRIKRQFPLIARLLEHRDALQQLFENRGITTAAAAIVRLKQWCEQGTRLQLYAIRQFNKTLTTWMAEVANYWVSRSSNGRTEGYNRGLRGILWRACGMMNFEHFRLRALYLFQ